MRQVLEAFHFGDRAMLNQHPELKEARILVHFHAKQTRYNQVY
jgi:hypothetical protein